MNIKYADSAKTALDIRLVPFGGSLNGRDSTGEYFSAKTNLCLEWFPDRRPLLYHHGLDSDLKTTPVGYIESVEIKDDGAWARAQLDRHNEYYGEITGLIDQGVLGASSGAMAHLVRKSRGGHIDVWPLVEGSLTPTPAEPFLATVDYATAKAHFKSIGVELPDSLKDMGGDPNLTTTATGGVTVPAHPENVPDSFFLHTENGKRYGLFRDATGTVDLSLLDTAMRQVQESDLPDDTKTRILARAQSMALEHGLKPIMTLTDGSGKAIPAKAVWSTAMVNDLPDSSFLYVEPGGKKDRDGKTTPRSLRHFPVKGADGEVDLPHLRNALARIPDAKLPDPVKQRVTRAAQKLAKAHGIDSKASKAAMATPMGANGDYDGCYEELIDDLRGLLNPRTPWGMNGYSSIVCTYPDYVIACRSGDYDSGEDPTYWHISYDINEDGDPVLGQATQVEQTWVPAKTYTTEGPLYLDVQALTRDARMVEQRTEALFQRRVKEGRVLSAANMKMLEDMAGTLTEVAAKVRALLEASNRTGQEQAKAAYLESSEYLRAQLALWNLAAVIPALPQ